VRRAALLLLLGGAAAACGALGSVLGSDAAPPSAGVGPFRALYSNEVRGKAPYVLDGNGIAYREPSALAADPSDPSSMSVFLYAVTPPPLTGGPTTVIVRARADDARSFSATGDGGTLSTVVLTASLAWEGGSVAGPSALRVGSSVYLYYAAVGGIGLARSSDGASFTKEPAPILAHDPTVRWETTAPFAPSVAQLPDGSFDMMYAAGVSIGEATSADGVHFTRVDADLSTPAMDPVLSPLGAPTAADGGPDGGADGAAEPAPPFDMAQVSDPCVLPTTTPAGRTVIRVLYTGFDGAVGSSTRSSAIGLAARFGASGPLVRQPEPAFSISKQEAAPTLFTWSGGALLYVHANEGLFSPYAAIAAGVAPTEIMLSTLAPDGGSTQTLLP